MIDDADVETIVTDWKKQEEKLNEELEVADAETAKTDHTLWFKKTGWAEHIAGCTLRHLSEASRLPDRDEHMLKKAVELNSALLERCVAGLSSLDNETRRWLRSAKHSEIDQRPLARLQNTESQQTYAVYMARLLCYSLRVLQSCEDHESSEQAEAGSRERNGSRGEESGTEDDSDGESDRDSSSNSDSDSDGNMDAGSEPAIDVFRDARKLYL